MSNIDQTDILLLTQLLEEEKKGHAFKLFLCIFGFVIFMVLVMATGAALASSLFDPGFFQKIGIAAGREDEFATWAIGVLSVVFPLAGTCLIAWMGVHDCLNSMNTVIKIGRANNEKLFAIVVQRVQCTSKGAIANIVKTIALG